LRTTDRERPTGRGGTEPQAQGRPWHRSSRDRQARPLPSTGGWTQVGRWTTSPTFSTPYARPSCRHRSSPTWTTAIHSMGPSGSPRTSAAPATAPSTTALPCTWSPGASAAVSPRDSADAPLLRRMGHPDGPELLGGNPPPSGRLRRAEGRSRAIARGRTARRSGAQTCMPADPASGYSVTCCPRCTPCTHEVRRV
jgi:hypothetical protein